MCLMGVSCLFGGFVPGGRYAHSVAVSGGRLKLLRWLRVWWAPLCSFDGSVSLKRRYAHSVSLVGCASLCSFRGSVSDGRRYAH